MPAIGVKPMKGRLSPTKREQLKSGRSSRGSTTASKTKESAVLTEGSLAILAREIGVDKLSGIILPMYLNIPNTTIVNVANDASECGLKDVSDTIKIEVATKLLLMWKGLKAGAKEKDKLKDLDRALREMGKADFADVIADKHANQIELTSDAFAS